MWECSHTSVAVRLGRAAAPKSANLLILAIFGSSRLSSTQLQFSIFFLLLILSTIQPLLCPHHALPVAFIFPLSSALFSSPAQRHLKSSCQASFSFHPSHRPNSLNRLSPLSSCQSFSSCFVLLLVCLDALQSKAPPTSLPHASVDRCAHRRIWRRTLLLCVIDSSIPFFSFSTAPSHIILSFS